MKYFINTFIIRNFKKIPYFFENKSTFYIQQSNYALIGKLSTSLLHDILTPLTSLSLSVDIADKSNTQVVTPIIKHSTSQIQEYVNIMRDFLIETKPNSKIHVNTEISKCLILLKHKTISHNIQIQYIEFDQVYSRIHPLHIYQIIINLVSNAIEASIESKTKKIVLILKKDRNAFHIECKDFGTGMSLKTLSAIGKNNFSTKSKERGFGVHSVQHIVQDILKGKLLIQSELNNGSLFSCILPMSK